MIDWFSADALARRKKFMHRYFDSYDLPVNPSYIKIIEAMGARKKVCSRWLNACSFFMSPEVKERVEKLWFVKKVEPVRILKVRVPKDKNVSLFRVHYDSSFAGITYRQLELFNINKVHDMGYLGEGVKIGFLDTGLRKNNFALRMAKIEKEHDFITGDDIFVVENDSWIKVVQNFSLIESPVLLKTSYGWAMIFIADSTPTLPVQITQRQCFISISQDFVRWSNPVKFSDKFYARNLKAASFDSIVVAIWEGGDEVTQHEIYLTILGKDSVLSKEVLTRSGKNPGICINDTNIIIAWFDTEGLKYREGSISHGKITWDEEKIFELSYTGAVSNPVMSYKDGWIIAFIDYALQGIVYFLNGTKYLLPIENPISLDLFKEQGEVYLVVSCMDKEPQIKLLNLRNEKFVLIHTWQKYAESIDAESVNGITGILIESYGKVIFFEKKDGTWSENEIAEEFSYHPFIGVKDGVLVKGFCVRGDDNTDYDPEEDAVEQPNHGTKVVGVVGGYIPGSYVGVAPAATFYIAKTEKYEDINEREYELQVEEDTWIEGLEWLEKEGVEIVNSSLGYSDWYSYEDMDGKTSPASIAASLAAKRGVVIVTAMGNVTKAHPYMVVPADAEGVVSVGGITTDSSWWAFTETIVGSAIGPTYDGRMKPELVALADSVWVVSIDTTAGYMLSGGTSFATAIVSGIFALVLSAHPEWKNQPESLKLAVFTTASNYNTPNDTIGYGIPDAFKAVYFKPPTGEVITENMFLSPFPNPYYPSLQGKIYFPFQLYKGGSSITLQIYSSSGRLIFYRELKEGENEYFAPGRYETKELLERIKAFWDGKDLNGREVSPGLYIAVLATSFGNDVTKFMLLK